MSVNCADVQQFITFPSSKSIALIVGTNEIKGTLEAAGKITELRNEKRLHRTYAPSKGTVRSESLVATE